MAARTKRSTSAKYSRSPRSLKTPIFLSASVPNRPPYSHHSDAIAIREAILALVAVAARERLIVFGGHPAISPLVEHAARSLRALHNIVIYQSRLFQSEIPIEARAFQHFHWTKSTRNRASSLELMRFEMVRSQPFCAAVFIGGMEGVLNECRMFKELHPQALLLPIASTLGAAKEIFDAGEGPDDRRIRQKLLDNTRYRALFRIILP